MSYESNEKYTEVKSALLMHVPFFGTLLFDMMRVKIGKFPHIFPPGNETAATNGRMIYVDEDFLAKLKLPEAVFLFCHEVGHAMWQHMARAKGYQHTGIRGKPFNAMKWNFAGDYLINDMLVKANCGKMPDGGLLDRKFTHEAMSIEDVYEQLPDDPCGGGGGGGKGDGDGSGGGSASGMNAGAGQKNSQGQGMLDNHLDADSEGGQGDATEADWKRAVAGAAANAKAQGKLPASMERLVNELLTPKVPWQDILRTTLMRVISRDTITWAKPHRRRLITQKVIMPSYTGFGAGVVVVAVDTSGSISEKELTVFLTELQNILDVAKPELVYLVPCDARVHEVTQLTANDNLAGQKISLGGGGGTSFIPVFEWVEENGVEPAALVYLTDMMGSFPNDPPPYNVIWAATTDHEAPWGQIIEIDIEDYDA